MKRSWFDSKSKNAIGMGIVAVGLGAYAWFNGDPQASRASQPDGYVLYGIQSDTAQLVRYDFTSDSLSTVGTVQDAALNSFTGIEGSAYFPGFSNIFSFWTDPSDELTKLVYISAVTGQAVVMGNDLGPEKITGACAVNPNSTTYNVYALQESDVIPFVIDNSDTGTVAGEVVPEDPTAARVTVLGAAISYGGQYDMPVTVRVLTDSSTTDPFGDANLPVNGDVNDSQNPRAYIFPNDLSAGTQINIGAKAWVKTDSAYDGSQNSHWTTHLAVDSSTATNNVITLRNGDPVPQIGGFLDQASVPSYLQDYINHANDTILLGDSQAIYLFELGSTVSVDPVTQSGSLTAAQDFQDLVVLVTMAPESQELVTGNVTTGVINGNIMINPGNNDTFIFELVKPDDSVITREDLLSATTADLDSNGTYFQGTAKSVRIKPRGNGAQQGLTVDGQGKTLKNNTTYTFEATNMTVRIYNTAAQGSTETIADSFNTASYSNNDGTQNFTSSWYPDDGATGGTRRVTDGELRIDNQDGGDAFDEYKRRDFDLSGATTATLTIDYSGVKVNDDTDNAVQADQFYIAVSDSGTDDCLVTLGTPTIIGSTPTSTKVSYKLEDSMTLSSTMMLSIRPVTGSFQQAGEYFAIENVEISHNGNSANASASVPMGAWRIEITTAQDVTDGDPGDDPTKASQLILVDQRTGDFTPIMQLSLPYTGLASQDGQTFYAVSGKKIYVIDTVAGTETLLMDHYSGDYSALGFAGAAMNGFGLLSNTVVPLSTSTGNIDGLPVGMGVAGLKTIVFTPSSKDPGRGIYD